MPEEREPCLGDADAILALLPPPVPRKVEEALTEARVLAAKLIEECIWPTSAGRVLAQVDAALSTLSALRQPSALDNARTPGHPDAYLNALLDYTSGFYASAIAHGMKAGPAADAVQHVERAARGLHALALAAQPSALDSGDGGEVGR
ncbi:hypothetical protein [Methylocaldum sp.]|uniref:hypothetical protein n=1 Tax=Methylocaldum sp. TaxID=1969727 RepID=UPI002D265A28|nr:hypothetical protein [Methylocaldum sp.]HYE38254.1 hypothetical protein [Methylocaldum sp.]